MYKMNVNRTRKSKDFLCCYARSICRESQVLTVGLMYELFTFEHWGKFPYPKPSNRRVLTEGRFEQKQGHTSKYEGQKVWDQEGA